MPRVTCVWAMVRLSVSSSVFLMETNARKSLSSLNFVAIMFQSVRMGNVLLNMDAVYDHGIVHEIGIIVWT